MAQLNILNLPVAIALDGTEWLPIQRVAGTTQRTTTSAVSNSNLDLISSVQGAVLFRGVTQWQALLPGTSGQVLSTQGAAADPSWVSNAGVPVGGTAGQALTKSSSTDYDSAWTSFLQSGTGAVARTWQAKDADVVSVKDFGAVGDGTTNDTVAFNAALATGKSIYVPDGSYLLNALTAITQSGTLFGNGRTSILIFNTTGAGIDVNLGQVQNKNFVVRDLTFKNVTNTPAAFVRNSNSLNFLIERCYFVDSSVTWCIENLKGYGFSVRDCIFSNMTGSGIKLSDNGVDLYSYAASVNGCDLTSVSGTGIQVGGTSYFELHDTVIEGIGGIALDVLPDATTNATAKNIIISACHFEANSGTDINLNSGVRICAAAITACVFAGSPVIALGTGSSVTLIQVSGATADPLTITGSSAASALLIDCSDITNSGVPFWSSIVRAGGAIFAGGIYASGSVLVQSGGSLGASSTGRVTWSVSGDAGDTVDTGLSRVSPGIVGVGTGAQGSVAGTLSCAATTASGKVWSGSVSSALSTLTGGSDGFRSSSTNVTQMAGESTTTSGSGGGALVGVYSNDGAAMASGDRLGGIRMGGSSSASALRNSALIAGFADQDWVDVSAYGSRLEFQNTTNGATALSTKAILSNAGIFALGATLANTVPALKPSSTSIVVRLADDSADADLTAANITASATLRINAAPAAIGTGVKTVSNAADGTTNFGHYIAINMSGTIYYIPASSVAPT